MSIRNAVTLIVLAALALVVMAPPCNPIDSKRLRLRDIDQNLAKYENTEWDGLAKHQVHYIATGSSQVDEFALQSAVVLGEFAQARFVANKITKDMKKYKNPANHQAADQAREQLKIARKLVDDALVDAPKLHKKGKDVINDPRAMATCHKREKEIVKDLKTALDRLSKVSEEGPGLAKQLAKLSAQLGGG
jgi:hypothetical protein